MWQVNNKSETGCMLASLILQENGIELSEKKIATLLNCAGIKFEKFWPSVFVNMNRDFNILNLVGYKKIQQTISKTREDVQEKSETQVKKTTSTSCTSSGENMGFGLFE